MLRADKSSEEATARGEGRGARDEGDANGSAALRLVSRRLVPRPSPLVVSELTDDYHQGGRTEPLAMDSSCSAAVRNPTEHDDGN